MKITQAVLLRASLCCLLGAVGCSDDAGETPPVGDSGPPGASFDGSAPTPDAGGDAATARDAATDAGGGGMDAGRDAGFDAGEVFGPDEDAGPADWIIESADDAATAEFVNGELRLTDRSTAIAFACPNGPCKPVKVFQEGLTGDFEARISIVEFIPDDSFARACFYVIDLDSEETYACFIGSSNQLRATRIDGSSSSSPIDGTPRSLRIARSGSSVTLMLETTIEAPERTGSISDGPLSIGVYVDNRSGMETTVSFDDFVIRGGRGVASDDFER